MEETWAAPPDGQEYQRYSGLEDGVIPDIASGGAEGERHGFQPRPKRSAPTIAGQAPATAASAIVAVQAGRRVNARLPRGVVLVHPPPHHGSSGAEAPAPICGPSAALDAHVQCDGIRGDRTDDVLDKNPQSGRYRIRPAAPTRRSARVAAPRAGSIQALW